MKIQVVGSGCPTCKKLHELVSQAVQELRMNIKVEYITGQDGMKKIIDLGEMSSPLVVIDDDVVMRGFVPNIDKLKKIIQAASEK